MGANFTFGHRGGGTVELLPADRGAVRPHGRGRGAASSWTGGRVSSSSIREALAAGDLAWPRTRARPPVRAGRRGRVRRTAGEGAGVPDREPADLAPTAAARSGHLRRRGRAWRDHRYPAAIDVGTNPTFGIEPLHVEAFLLDFEGDAARRADRRSSSGSACATRSGTTRSRRARRGDRRRRAPHARGRRSPRSGPRRDDRRARRARRRPVRAGRAGAACSPRSGSSSSSTARCRATAAGPTSRARRRHRPPTSPGRPRRPRRPHRSRRGGRWSCTGRATSAWTPATSRPSRPTATTTPGRGWVACSGATTSRW